ncbi:oligosaccharide flippase family protein [Deinococcus arcticus]|uniref:oligosaccharide flippase family protein n=1 Tax=Deinococcus arcticus TaxID=2136176 RepID=UPI0013048BF8|nr:oligosaccharide flippase family protein [Deinococcus arcticus]
MNNILRVLAVLLASSLVTLAAGLVRQKMLALELGPVGVGQLGLLTSLAGAIATLIGLGLSTSGVQRVTVTSSTSEADAAQRSLTLGSLVLGLVAGILGAVLAPSFGLNSDGLDRWAVGLAALLTIVSGGQLALLNGLGQLHKIAWVNSGSAILGTLLTVVTLVVAPRWGLHTALLAPLLLTALLAAFAQRQHRAPRSRTLPGALWPQLRAMVSLGAVFAVGTGIATLGQYGARWLIEKQFGGEALGQYQAAWALTMLYLGVLLSAMGTEFFPRITRAATEVDSAALTDIVRRQITLTVGLALPAICLLILLSEWIMTLFYSAEFRPAAALARQQFMGDIFKLAAWAIGFTLLARQAKRHMFLLEVLWIAVYLPLLWILTRTTGFAGVGWAYAGAYAVYLIASIWAYRHQVGVALPARLWAGVAAAAALAGVHLWGSSSNVWVIIMATLDLIALGAAGAWFLKLRRTRLGSAG